MLLVKPRLGLSGEVFIKGKKVTLGDKYLEECREGLIGGIAQEINDLCGQDLWDCKYCSGENDNYDLCKCSDGPDLSRMKLRGPRGVTGNTNILFYIAGDKEDYSKDPSYYSNHDCSDALIAAYEMLGSLKKQRELFKLLDVIVGGVAVLTAGPKSFKLRKTPKPQKTSVVYSSSGDPYWGGTRKSKTSTYTFGHRIQTLEYQRLSSLIFRDGSTLSLLLGLVRFCVTLYLNGYYKKIDGRLNIDRTLTKLKMIATKDSLGAADKRWLLAKIKQLEPYYSNPKVLADAGGYPLNNYTWKGFIAFCNREQVNTAEAWGEFKGFYGIQPVGFIDWCRKNKLIKKKRANWSGHGEDIIM